MNLFAVAVVALQLLAAGKYAWDTQYLDAGIWVSAAAINILLIFKAA